MRAFAINFTILIAASLALAVALSACAAGNCERGKIVCVN